MPTLPVVAIVENDRSCREIAELLLKRSGMEPRVFATGDEFLAWSKGARCDCILLDASLPGLENAELQQALDEMGEHVPILFITDEDDVVAASALLSMGAMDVIPRPIDLATLLPKVREAIDAKAA